MATGRMIVKEFCYDARVWAVLSERDALILVACIPNVETDGTLPADPRVLRCMDCPISRNSDSDEANAITALEEKLKADDYEGMTERSQWKATAADRPFLYVHWWS